MKMIITASNEHGDFDNWYEVIDPYIVKSRVDLVNHLPTFLMIVAKKTADRKVFLSYPQQSDYVSIWKKNEEQEAIFKSGIPNHRRRTISEYLPVRLRNVLSVIYRELKSSKSSTKDLGVIDNRFYKKMDV